MDHQTPDSLPSVELPSPAAESSASEYSTDVAPPTENTLARQLEQGISATATQTATPQQPAGQQVVPQAAPVVPHDAPPTGVQGMAITPQIADDSDLIEKEWVVKAKQIVERTKDDPHQQNKEMNLMKADYLKKRYNKDIKLSE